MAVDWPTILTAAAAGAASSGLVLFAARKLIGGLIDSRIRRADEQHKLEMQEHIRRRGALFDQQSQALDELTALVYRIRNASREIAESEDMHGQLRAAEKSLRLVAEAFQIEMFNRRAVVPSVIFNALHELRSPVYALLADLDVLRRSPKKEAVMQHERIANTVAQINAIYEAVVSLTHGYRGIDAESTTGKNNRHSTSC